MLEGDNPSARKRGLSKPPAFPGTAWGCRPKTLHFFSHSAFSGFARLREASPACFLASRAFARLSRCVFLLRACAHCFPGVFSGFARVRTASLADFWAFRMCARPAPACFLASRVCARLSRRVFGLFACARGFPRRVFWLRACAHGLPRAGCAHSGRKIADLVPASCRIELPVAVKSAILPA